MADYRTVFCCVCGEENDIDEDDETLVCEGCGTMLMMDENENTWEIER